MCPYEIKILISLKQFLPKPKILNGSVYQYVLIISTIIKLKTYWNQN